MGRIQQRTGAADAARSTALRNDPGSCGRRPWRGRACGSSRPLRPGRAGRARGQPAADDAGGRRLVLRPGRGVAARGARSWAPGPASGSWTPARHRAARRRRWRPPCRDEGLVVGDRPSRASRRPAGPHGGGIGRAVDSRSAGGRRAAAALLARCSMPSCSTRPARALASSGATRTSSGGVPRRISRRSPRPSAGCCIRQPAFCAPADGSSMRPVRASRRKTTRSSTAFLEARPDVRGWPAAGLSEAVRTLVDRAGRLRTLAAQRSASNRFSPRPW